MLRFTLQILAVITIVASAMWTPAATAQAATRWGVIEVRANWPIQPGDTIEVRGANFLPNRTASIRLGTTGNAFPDTDSAGRFNWTRVKVPTFLETGRSHQLRVVQYGTPDDAEAQWDIYMPRFDPWAQPSRWYVRPGDSIDVRAHGFMAGERVQLIVDGKLVGAGIADSNFGSEGSLVTPIRYVVASEVATSVLSMSLVGETSGAVERFSISVGRH